MRRYAVALSDGIEGKRCFTDEHKKGTRCLELHETRRPHGCQRCLARRRTPLKLSPEPKRVSLAFSLQQSRSVGDLNHLTHVPSRVGQSRESLEAGIDGSLLLKDNQWPSECDWQAGLL
jgi:hypothetical protein